MQESNLEIRDKNGSTNVVANHLLRLPHLETSWVTSNLNSSIIDFFKDDVLCAISTKPSWFACMANYLECGISPSDWSRFKLNKLRSKAKYYIWKPPFMWRICSDKVLKKCVDDCDVFSILEFFHSYTYGGNFSAKRTSRIFDCGLYWPSLFKDSFEFCKNCLKCQKVSSQSKRHEMPQMPILFCEIFDVWGINFMGLFPSSFGNNFILLCVDYVSKWIEAIPTHTCDARVVEKFLKSFIFCRYGVPKALVSDQGSHFGNKVMRALLAKYGIKHKVSTPFHPQTNGQAMIFDREVKAILLKVVNTSRKDWSLHLEDAFKTPLGMSPFQLANGKARHPSIEIEHKAYQAIKKLNMDEELMAKERLLQIQELKEMRLDAFENSTIYKEKTKLIYDQMVVGKEFHVCDLALLYQTRFIHKIAKLKSKWEGPFLVIKVFPYRVLQLLHKPSLSTLQFNRHLCKLFKKENEEAKEKHNFKPP